MSARTEDPMAFEMLEVCLSRIEAGEPKAVVLDTIAKDPGTRAELAGLVAASSALRDLPLPALPPIDQAAIEADLLAHAAAQGGPAPGSVWRPWLNLLIVGLGLIGALTLWRGMRSASDEADLAQMAAVDDAAAEAAASTGQASAAQEPAPGASTSGESGDRVAPLAAQPSPSGTDSAVAILRASPSASPTSVLDASPTPEPARQALALLQPAASVTASATASPSPKPPAPSDPGEKPPEEPKPSPTPSPTSTATPVPTATATPSPTYPPTATATATPSPLPEALLEVIVREAEGSDPIAEAGVVAEREDGGPSVEGRTNGDGNARLVLVGGVDYRILVERDSYRSRWWPDAEDRSGADLVRVAAGGSREIELRLPRSDVSIDTVTVSR